MTTETKTKRTATCHGCTKVATIPSNRSRPNKWNTGFRYFQGDDYGVPGAFYCPACWRVAMDARHAAEEAAKAAAKAEAERKHAEAVEAERVAEEARKAAWAKLPEGFTSWRPEVIADGSGVWCGNALRFATRQEAEDNVFDLSMRWLLVRDTRTVPSKDPVNYRWTKDGLVPVEEVQS